MLDLKATFRARKYTYRIINALNLNAKEFVNFGEGIDVTHRLL